MAEARLATKAAAFGAFLRLAAGELVVLGAAVGLAVALSRSPTPVPSQVVEPDPLVELLGFDISKAQQSSDWGGPDLSEAQKEYAASDVLYLHALRDRLTDRLTRDGRYEHAKACFEFLPTRAKLDLGGWEAEDIFAHS